MTINFGHFTNLEMIEAQISTKIEENLSTSVPTSQTNRRIFVRKINELLLFRKIITFSL